MRIEVYDMVNMNTNTSVPVEETKIILNKYLRLKNQQLNFRLNSLRKITEKLLIWV